MNEYEINEDTLALMSIDEHKTKVYEVDDEFIVNKSANKIMEASCAYFGSSLEGRQKGTSSLVGITHKAPVIIEESKEIIFFPTKSPRLDTCSWISLNHVDTVVKNNGKGTILFKNKKKINTNLSTGIITNQVLRASRLESVLRNRKK